MDLPLDCEVSASPVREVGGIETSLQTLLLRMVTEGGLQPVRIEFSRVDPARHCVVFQKRLSHRLHPAWCCLIVRIANCNLARTGTGNTHVECIGLRLAPLCRTTRIQGKRQA